MQSNHGHPSLPRSADWQSAVSPAGSRPHPPPTRSSRREEALTLNLRAPEVDGLALRGQSLSVSGTGALASHQSDRRPRLSNANHLECDDSSPLSRLATRRQTTVHTKAAQADFHPPEPAVAERLHDGSRGFQATQSGRRRRVAERRLTTHRIKHHHPRSARTPSSIEYPASSIRFVGAWTLELGAFMTPLSPQRGEGSRVRGGHTQISRTPAVFPFHPPCHHPAFAYRPQ
jgi:hypothetical protein